MARDLFFDLLLTAALRPHRHCLKRSSIVNRHIARQASTKVPIPSSPDNSKIPPATKTPLHVGLDRNPEGRSAISRIPIPKGEKGENFTPSVLARPLGLKYPPRSGQNTPLDKRTWSQKRADYQDYDEAIKRRKVLLRSFFRPYFQDRKYVNYHEGKSFVSNERLFRKDKALYFPNMWGETLSPDGDGPDGGRDTTDTLRGKVTVVAFHGPRWAELQVETFLAPDKNPELKEIIKNSNGTAQQVNINIQENIFHQWFVKMYKGRMRKTLSQDMWNRYFLVKIAQDTRQGLTDEIRDAMGLLNKNVGYVYLLDTDCRIRWAASGNAWTGEVNNLNAGLKRLIEENASLNKLQQNATSSRIPPADKALNLATPA